MQDQPPRLDAPPETLDDDPDLRVVSAHPIVGIDPTTPVETALQVMIARDIRHMPVVDGARCTGLVTEGDLLRGVAAERGPLGRTTLRVSDVAGRAVTLPAGARLSDATVLMAREHVDAILVMTEGRVGGIVTATDVVRFVAARTPPHPVRVTRFTRPTPDPNAR
jgi:CBS domain-containing protein